MSQPGWIPEPLAVTTDQPVHVGVPITGAVAPQRGSVPAPVDMMLGTIKVDPRHARVWVVGAHGGSGESTVAALIGGTTTDHRWPHGPSTLNPPAVVLCARTDARGLAAAQAAARAWAAGTTPPVRLLGMFLIADQPKKMPRELSDKADLIAGGVPHVWRLPWVDTYRTNPLAPTPKEFRKQLRELESVIASEIGETQ